MKSTISFSIILTAIAASILHMSGIPWHAASIAIIISFAIICTGFLIAGRPNQLDLATRLPKTPKFIAAATWFWAMLAYLVYMLGLHYTDLATTRSLLEGALKFFGMMTVPMLLAVVARRMSVKQQPWWLMSIILVIWTPFDSGLLASIWPWPDGGAAYMLNVWISCVLAISAMSLAGVQERYPADSFRIVPRVSDVQATVRDQLWFTPVAIGLGFMTGFFAWNPKVTAYWQYPVEALGIYLTIALPEELLFRGLMQPVLESFSWPRGINRLVAGKWLTAIIFGLSHLNNDPIGDWRYVILATIAGIAYANVYERTGRRSLAAPALLHTVVDWLWSTFLRSF